MGYSSDVRCLIYGEPDKLNAFIVKHKLLGNDVFAGYYAPRRGRMEISVYEPPLPVTNGAALNIMKGEVRRVMLEFLDLNCESTRWYDTDADEQTWLTLLADLDENGEDMDINYEFVRIGEDSDDVEQRCGFDGHTYLGVSKLIAEYDLNLERIDDAEAEQGASADAHQPSVLRNDPAGVQDGPGRDPQPTDGRDEHDRHFLSSGIFRGDISG